MSNLLGQWWEGACFDICFQSIDDCFEDAGLEPQAGIEAGGSNAVLEYTRRGLGVGILSGLVPQVRADPALHALPVTGLFGELGYGFVLRSGRYRTAAVRAFLAQAGVSTDRLA